MCTLYHNTTYDNLNKHYGTLCSALTLPFSTPGKEVTHVLLKYVSTGLSSLSHTANSPWLSILHMVLYMFPCYSLHSSHSLTPHCVHKSVGLHLLCCPANRFISTIFLDSIYICINIQYLFFSFWLTSVRIALGSSASLELTQMFSFYGWAIFHCIYESVSLSIHLLMDI